MIEFTGFNLNEGANRCTIDIGAGDFAPDNRFYFTLRRETPAKALIIEGASRGRSDSLHLQSALTTNDDLPFTFTLKSAGIGRSDGHFGLRARGFERRRTDLFRTG